MEEWREYLPGYLVSNYGRIKSLKTNKILKQVINKNGYCTCCVSLGSRKKKKCFRVHIAVATLFIDNPNNYPFVNHKDCNKTNNCVDNLEWCTPKENTQHAANNGLILHGEDRYCAKLTEDAVRYIRSHYKPRDKDFNMCALAEQFSVTSTTISHVIKGDTWKHVL